MLTLTNTTNGLGEKKKGWMADLLGQLAPDVVFSPAAAEVVVAAVEVTLVAGNTFRAIMLPAFSPSYMIPPYPGHIWKPDIMGPK